MKKKLAFSTKRLCTLAMLLLIAPKATTFAQKIEYNGSFNQKLNNFFFDPPSECSPGPSPSDDHRVDPLHLNASYNFETTFKACILDLENHRWKMEYDDIKIETGILTSPTQVLEDAQYLCKDRLQVNQAILSLSSDYNDIYSWIIESGGLSDSEISDILKRHGQALTKRALKDSMKSFLTDLLNYDEILNNETPDIFDSEGKLDHDKLMKFACQKSEVSTVKTTKLSPRDRKIFKELKKRYNEGKIKKGTTEELHYQTLKEAMANKGYYKPYSNVDGRLSNEYFKLKERHDAGESLTPSQLSRLDYLEYGYRHDWSPPGQSVIKGGLGKDLSRSLKYRGNIGLNCLNPKVKQSFSETMKELIDELDNNGSLFSSKFRGDNHVGTPNSRDPRGRSVEWVDQIDDLVDTYNIACSSYQNELNNFMKSSIYSKYANLYNQIPNVNTLPTTIENKYSIEDKVIPKLLNTFVVNVNSTQSLDQHRYLKYAKFSSMDSCPKVQVSSTTKYDKDGKIVDTDRKEKMHRDCEFFFNNQDSFSIVVSLDSKSLVEEMRNSPYSAFFDKWVNRQKQNTRNSGDNLVVSSSTIFNSLKSADNILNERIKEMRKSENLLLSHLTSSGVKNRSIDLSKSFKQNCIEKGTARNLTSRPTRLFEEEDGAKIENTMSAVKQSFSKVAQRIINGEGNLSGSLHVKSELYESINQRVFDQKERLMEIIDDYQDARDYSNHTSHTSKRIIRDYAKTLPKVSASLLTGSSPELDDMIEYYRNEAESDDKVKKHFSYIALLTCRGIIGNSKKKNRNQYLIDASQDISLMTMPLSFFDPISAGVSTASGLTASILEYYSAKKDYTETRNNLLRLANELESNLKNKDYDEKALSRVQKAYALYKESQLRNTVFGEADYLIPIMVDSAPFIGACASGASHALGSTLRKQSNKTVSMFNRMESEIDELLVANRDKAGYPPIPELDISHNKQLASQKPPVSVNKSLKSPIANKNSSKSPATVGNVSSKKQNLTPREDLTIFEGITEEQRKLVEDLAALNNSGDYLTNLNRLEEIHLAGGVIPESGITFPQVMKKWRLTLSYIEDSGMSPSVQKQMKEKFKKGFDEGVFGFVNIGKVAKAPSTTSKMSADTFLHSKNPKIYDYLLKNVDNKDSVVFVDDFIKDNKALKDLFQSMSTDEALKTLEKAVKACTLGGKS